MVIFSVLVRYTYGEGVHGSATVDCTLNGVTVTKTAKLVCMMCFILQVTWQVLIDSATYI